MHKQKVKNRVFYRIASLGKSLYKLCSLQQTPVIVTNKHRNNFTLEVTVKCLPTYFCKNISVAKRYNCRQTPTACT